MLFVRSNIRTMLMMAVGPFKACQCNGLATACNDDGECLGCTSNTAGDSCEYCAAGFYTPSSAGSGSASISSGNGNDDAVDAEPACASEDIEKGCGKSMTDCQGDLGCSTILLNFRNDDYKVTAADMQDGFFKIFFACVTQVCDALNSSSSGSNDENGDSSADVAECLPCNCNAVGTAKTNLGDKVQTCDREGGGCVCIGGVGGRACDQCPTGTFGPIDRSAAIAAGAEDAGTVCAPCACADGQSCDALTGDCSWNCDGAHTGKGCVGCATGWYAVIQGNMTSGTPAICKQCDPECDEAAGCNAGGGSVNACNGACANMRNATHCISECSAGSFQDVSPLMDSAGTCHLCHDECSETCSSKGASETACDYNCRNKIFEGTCVPQCPSRGYDAGGQYCGTCHNECAGGCVGPTEFDCDTAGCKHVVDDGGCNSACRTGDFAHRMSVTSQSGQVIFVCRRCHENCDRIAGCHGPSDSDCNRCSDKSFVQVVAQAPGLQCVDKCEVGTYSAFDNIRGEEDDSSAAFENVCFPCNVQCKSGCDGPSAQNCTAGCRNANFDGACVEACPLSTYSTGDNKTAVLTCVSCNDNCKECDGPGEDDCLQCADASFASSSGHCTVDCGADMYGAFGRCMACDSECKDGCTASGSRGGACNSCKHFSFGNSCYSKCPHMTVSAPNSTACIPCHASCAGGCDGPADTDCAQCLSVTVDGRCLAGCPKGSFRVASGIPGQADTCTECSGHCDAEYGCHGPRPADCVVCRKGTIFYNGACVEACPHGYYADVPTNGGRSTCQPCNTVCSNDLADNDTVGDDATAAAAVPMCSGPLAEECTKCGGDQAVGGSCVAKCPDLQWAAAASSTDENDDGVPDGSKDSQPLFDDSKQCTRCHEECAEGCRGAGPKACKACKHFNHDGRCVKQCPVLTYGDTEQKACVACSGLCAVGCLGPHPEHCVGDGAAESICSRNSLITELGLCASSCNPLAEYRQESRCMLCDEECATASGCSGHGPGKCGACRHFELSGACVAACPQGWHAPAVADITNSSTAASTDGGSGGTDSRTCQRCDPLCTASGCTGPGVEGCRACRFINANGTCAAFCPEGSYQDGKGCRKCNAECASGCIGPLASDCMRCKNWRSQRGICSPECNQDATFADVVQKQCHECHPQCLSTPGSGGCPTGSRADQCSVCRKFSDNGICKESCSPHQYPRREPEDLARALSGSCISCHPLCGQNGCVGPNSNDCVAGGCQTLSIVEPDAPSGFRCVENECPQGTYEDAGSRICRSCHEQCLFGCSGGSNGDCIPQAAAGSNADSAPVFTAATLGCRNAAQPFPSGNGTLCLNSCTIRTFKADSGICEACNPICGDSGCTGHPDRCGVRPEQKCSKDSDYFDASTSTCRPCNPQCKSPAGGGPSCRGGGADACTSCAYAHLGEVCVGTCETASPSQTHYYFDPATKHCRECHAECAGGCTGPSAANCNACKNYKLAQTDLCVAMCEEGKEYSAVVSTKLSNGAAVDVAVCNPCNPLLGPGPTECGTCGLVTADNGKCKPACESPKVPDGSGVCTCPTDAGAFLNNQGACKPCHAQCKATVGCAGYKPTECNADPSTGNHGCKHVQMAPSSEGTPGRCVDECPALERANPDTNVCECDVTASYFSETTGKCAVCHRECTQGCSGSTDADCLNAPGDGCLHVYFPAAVAAARADQDANTTATAISGRTTASPPSPNEVLAPAGAGGNDRSVGRCVTACGHEAGFAPVGPGRVCACTDGHFEDARGQCKPCSTACRNGCVGPLETSCTECASFMIDGACTGECPAGFVGDYVTRTCSQCHPECGANGCSVANDANRCIRKIGYSTCANVMDDGGCAAECPENRPYMIRATVTNPNDGHTGTIMTCTEWCPSDQPYFNDPRNATTVVDNLNVTQLRRNGTLSDAVDYDECREWEYEDGIQQKCGGYPSYAALVAAHAPAPGDGGESSQWHTVPTLGRICGASCAAIADGLILNKAFPNELRCSLVAVADVESTVFELLDATDRSAQIETKDIYVIAMACAGTLLLFAIYLVVKRKEARHKHRQKEMVVVGSPAPPVQHVAMYPGMAPTPTDITLSPSYVNPYSAYKNIQTPAALRMHAVTHPHQHPYGRPGASMVDSPSYVNAYGAYKNIQTPAAISQLRTGGGGGGGGRGGGGGGAQSRLRQEAPPRLVLEEGGGGAVPGSPPGKNASVTSSVL